jgi:siroheme synthase
MIKLKECQWICNYYKPIDVGGHKIDMYVIINEINEGVTIGVPSGRKDIADFIVRSCKAGQHVLRQLESGEPFVVDEGFKRRQS